VLRIGCPTEFGGGLVAYLARRYRERTPGLHVEIEQFPLSAPAAGLARRQVDVAVTEAVLAVNDELAFHPLFSEQQRAMMYRTDELTRHPVLTPLDIERSGRFCAIPPPNDPRHRAFWSVPGVDPSRAWVPRTATEYVQGVLLGDVVGMTTPSALAAHPLPGVVTVPLAEGRTVRIGLRYRHERGVDDLVVGFRCMVAEECEAALAATGIGRPAADQMPSG
jgi:DNA-binding transcriptional LysR family regulator